MKRFDLIILEIDRQEIKDKDVSNNMSTSGKSNQVRLGQTFQGVDKVILTI